MGRSGTGVPRRGDETGGKAHGFPPFNGSARTIFPTCEPASLHGEADFAANYIGMQDPEVEFTPLLKEPNVLACPAGQRVRKRPSPRRRRS
jgi:hypothetical protein